MLLVEELGFPLAHDLRLVALQGDYGLHVELGTGGGVYVLDDVPRATQGCLSLVDRARSENAHLALIPELMIPRQAVGELIEVMRASPQPLVVVGGIEGITPTQYRELVVEHGGTSDVAEATSGTYVNAMMVAVRTATNLRVYFRAKRFASGAENRGGPELARSTGQFLVLRLGSTPFVIVPLICAEFTWPDLPTKLQEDAAGLAIDLIPVLQRNWDMNRRYTGPVMHTAYQNNLQTRFVFANQAFLPEKSDGTCFVIVPPSCPNAPQFDHGRNELWLLDSTYKGFRIPERTGCFWYAEVMHPAGPGNAARPPVCAGRVISVLAPLGADLGGLSAGLMRSAAAMELRAHDHAWANTAPKVAYQSSLTSGDTYLLDRASRLNANDTFIQMTSGANPTWSTVERLVTDFVEAAALLACGGDAVRITPCPGGNCTVSQRPVAVLHAPEVDAALERRFPDAILLSGAALPAGIVLLRVEASSRIPHAKAVGDVLRADRVGSGSPQLSGGPTRSAESSVTIRLSDIYFCEPNDLRPSLDEATLNDARARSSRFLPGVYV
jgi:hypothetical protein